MASSLLLAGCDGAATAPSSAVSVAAPLDRSTVPETANSFPTERLFSDPTAQSDTGVIGVRHLPP